MVSKLYAEIPDWAKFLSIIYDNRRYFPLCALDRLPPIHKVYDFEKIQNGWDKTLRLIRMGVAPKQIGIYIHWPFCPSHCSFCFCNMALARSQGEMELELNVLKREINQFKETFCGFPMESLYIGGGTPTFMSAEMLDDLLSHIKSSFMFSPGAEIFTESSPATLDEAKLNILSRHGFNRISLGIETFDEQILGSQNRQGQTRQNAIDVFNMIKKKTPHITTDIDMIVGLPGQTPDIFLKDMEMALSLRPDCIHLYFFRNPPRVGLRKGLPISLADKERRTHLLGLADPIARQHGYRCDDGRTFANYSVANNQEASWRRFEGSILGIGHHAVSHAFGSYWYYHEPIPVSGEIQSFDLSRFLVYDSDITEEMRSFVVGFFAEYGVVSRIQFKSIFKRDIMDIGFLKNVIVKMEKLGVIDVRTDMIQWKKTESILERSLFAKLFYNTKLVRSILASEKESFLRFIQDLNQGDASWQDVAMESFSNSYFRMYYNLKQNKR